MSMYSNIVTVTVHSVTYPTYLSYRYVCSSDPELPRPQICMTNIQQQACILPIHTRSVQLSLAYISVSYRHICQIQHRCLLYVLNMQDKDIQQLPGSLTYVYRSIVYTYIRIAVLTIAILMYMPPKPSISEYSF